MLRTTSCVFNAKSLLYCRCSREFQLSPIHRAPPTVDSQQSKSYQSTPHSSLIKDIVTDKSLWIGLAVLAMSGYGIVCAHASPEFRDLLTIYAPWLDEVIAFLYQENMTYQEFVTRLAKDIKNSMVEIKNNVDVLIPKSTKQGLPEEQPIDGVPDNSRDR